METQDLAEPQPQTNAAQLPSVGILFTETSALYKKHIKTIVRIGMIPCILFLIAGLTSTEPLSLISGAFMVIGMIVNYLAFIAFLLVLKGDGAETGILDLYKKAARYFFPVIWVTALTVSATLAGLPFLIIPAIYIGLLLCFSVYIAITDDKKGLSPLIDSWHYVSGNWWPLFIRSILFTIGLLLATVILSAILGVIVGTFFPNLEAIAVGDDQTAASFFVENLISLFLVGPFGSIFMFRLLKTFKTLKPDPLTEEEARPIRKKIVILAWVGVLIWVSIAGIVITSSLFQTLSV